MYVKQLYTNCLAEAAYYIESNGEAAVIDPLRETAPYLEMAKERGTTIKYIFETHFHADFVSGHLDLSKATGAPIVFGPGAQTGFDSIAAEDGQVFTIGNVTLTVLHTPGHTPESSTYLLKDENGKEHAIFSGDTLFIGDVGRPDLAIKGDQTVEDLAGLLYDSLRNKIMPLPDDVIVYPAHGAGSACGKNMSDQTSATLGDQKRDNYALQDISKEVFIKELTTGILPPPGYFPKNALLNKNGYDPVNEVVTNGTRPLSVQDLHYHQEHGALVIDTRHQDDFSAGFIPNSLFLGLDGSYAVWAGTLISDLHQPIVLIADEGRAEEAVTRLARVGFDRILGYLQGGISSWQQAGNTLNTLAGVAANDPVLTAEGTTVLDVRKPGEYATHHVTHAQSRPLDFIAEWADQLPKDNTYHLHCKSGYRSVIASSILKRHGVHNIVDVKGGYEALRQTSIPMIQEPLAV